MQVIRDRNEPSPTIWLAIVTMYMHVTEGECMCRKIKHDHKQLQVAISVREGCVRSWTVYCWLREWNWSRMQRRIQELEQEPSRTLSHTCLPHLLAPTMPYLLCTMSKITCGEWGSWWCMWRNSPSVDWETSISCSRMHRIVGIKLE